MTDRNEIADFLLDNMINGNIEDDVLLSGGAAGADAKWSQLFAKHTGSENIFHFSYEEHKKYSTHAVGIRVILSENQLYDGDSALKEAKKVNRRNFPCRAHNTNCLLRRNYWQVRESGSCYAVSKIEDGFVAGGTNWATTMFVNRWMENNPFDECPCYVYDILTNKWHQWIFDRWEPIEAYEVPTPSGVWTGIGSRDLTLEAIDAMEALWQRTEQSTAQATVTTIM